MTDQSQDDSVENQKSTQNTSHKSDISLTDEEIKGNCAVFFSASYETTSTVLAFVAHILVNYPEVQEKVRSEIFDLQEREGKLDYNAVKELQYMEWVINETMRVYTPVIAFVTRTSLADYKYENITIPKGSDILIATHYIHNDASNWNEPDKFDPMRFSPEQKDQMRPYSWQPFGGGPRNCIGVRFALFEAKLSLAKLLLKYRFEPSPKTELGHLSTECKYLTMVPKNGVFLKFVKF